MSINSQDNNSLYLIERWNKILDLSVIHFSNHYSRRISRQETFDALFLLLSDEHSIEWSGDLWDVDIEYDAALQLLSDFNFNALNHHVSTERDILPADLVLSQKARVKDDGFVWLIHKYDKDPFPSNPHAHQIDNNIKLDLSNGRCYRIRQHVYTLNKKKLIDFRAKAEKVFDGNLPALAI
jgi:hypothetical protein